MVRDSGKTMTVTKISMNDKDQVEFTGKLGTFLIGDLKKMAKGGMAQGYDDRDDESIAMRKGRKRQNLKDRRDESKAEEKAEGNRPYSDVGTMDLDD